jgi:putative transposase
LGDSWAKQIFRVDSSSIKANRSSFKARRQRQGKVKPEREKLKAVLIEHHKESRASAGSCTLGKELQG